jgi:signal peptide peptidase SppA
MNIRTVQDKIWAILPSKLEEIDAVVLHYLNGGPKIDYDPKEYSNPMGIRIEGSRYSYQMDSGIRMIDIFGTIAQRANIMTEMSGGVSTEILNKEFQAALADPSVSGILLNINSPGGTVHGMQTLSDSIRAGRKKKPVCAYTDGLMCSAAYFIGSAASALIASETSQVGSIGVALTHYDMSKRDEDNGVKRTEIFAGRYKRMASDNKPLDKEGREYLQEMVDKYYTVFVEAVAKNRGVSTKKALEMADGRIFIGNEALDAGLVDHIGNLDTAVNLLTESWRNPSMNLVTDLIVDAVATVGQTVVETVIEPVLETIVDVVLPDAPVLDSVKEESNAELLQLRAELRRERIQSKVAALVHEGRVTPGMVDAGLVDRLTEMSEANAQWMVETFLGSLPIAFQSGHVAVDGQPKSGISNERAMALKIAQVINPDATIKED